MATIAERIKDYLQSEVIEPGAVAVLSDDTPLWDEELIDSMGIMMLIAHIEDEFGVDIEVDDVDVEHFKTVSTIAALVEGKQS